MKILSVDVGIKHLGLSLTSLHDNFEVERFEDVTLIDITNFKHTKVSRRNCKLHHDNNITDWINHVYQELDWFEISDYILMEHQPITGLVAVQELIRNKYRDKVIPVYPVSMHKFYNIRDQDYDRRKVSSETIALYYLNEYKVDDKVVNKFNNYVRKHDIGDSLLYTVYWATVKHKEYEAIRKSEEIKIKSTKCFGNMSLDDFFEQFKYKGKKEVHDQSIIL